MKLGDLVGRVAFHLDPLVVFKEPFYLAANESLFNVSLNIWVNTKRNVLLVLLDQNVIKVVFDIIQQEDGRPDGAGTMTGWTNLGSDDVHFRPYALAGNLN